MVERKIPEREDWGSILTQVAVYLPGNTQEAVAPSPHD